MKLHLPLALIAAVCCASAQAAQEQVTITDTTVCKTLNANNTDGSSVNAINHWEHAGAVNNTHITVESGAKVNSLVGGIVIGPRDYKNHTTLTDDTMDGGVVIDVSGGIVSGTVYGGNTLSQALPDADLPNTGAGNDYSAKLRESAEILGDKINVGSISINISGGEIGTVGGDEAIMGGGGRYCGTESTGGIEVNISGGTINNKVYAGTNGGSTGYTKLNITGGTINSDVYGAGRKDYGVVLGSTNVTISGGTINGNVYAAGDQDTVKGDATVNITGNGVKLDNIVSGAGTNGSKVLGQSKLLISGESSLGQVKDFEFILVQANTEIGSIENAADGTLLRNQRTLTIKNDLSVKTYESSSSTVGAPQLKVGGNMTVDNLQSTVKNAGIDVGGKLTVNTGQVTNATITADNIEVNGSFKLKSAAVGGHSDGVESLITVSETGNLTLDNGAKVENIVINGGRLTVLKDSLVETGSITLNEGSELYFDLTINYRPELPTATVDLGGNDLIIGNDVTITVAAIGMSEFDNTELVLFENIGDMNVSNLTVKFTDRNVAYDAIVSVRDGKVIATIPEPTTATLSLLALGALAARRRRR